MARGAAIAQVPFVLRYSLRDLLRNPRRTLASAVGVALAVALFSSTAFFVDGSAARMTERAIAPVAIDMQAGLTSPLASSLTLAEAMGGTSLAAGQPATVTIVVTTTADRPATAVVVQDAIPSQLTYQPGSTTLNGSPVAEVDGGAPLLGGLEVRTNPAGGKTTITYPGA